MNKYYSNIFWHFTGSPKNIKWDEVHKPADIIKDATTKSTYEAWDILKKILDSKILKATCNEKLYGYRETDKFCCVTDIPLMNLHRHKKYYEDVALGFNSSNIYDAFNPVLYTSMSGIIKKVISVEDKKEVWTKEQAENIGIDEEIAKRSGFELDDNGNYIVPTTTFGYSENTALEKYFLNFVKLSIFSDEAGESFYQEKEWRKIGDFRFEYDDLSAIIIPKSHLGEVVDYLSEKGITDISTFTWEILSKV
ncbi:MAG: abortive infection system antitoxin AbiGi family protein [Candidatus Paceibacterota bacterium]